MNAHLRSGYRNTRLAVVAAALVLLGGSFFARSTATLSAQSPDTRTGVPDTFAEHARLMFDLQVLAYQSDLTRVITFMVGREFSSRTYPEIGAPGGHHPLSHEHSAESQRQLTEINIHHATQVAYYIDRLASITDGDASLLDQTLIYYGAGMAEGSHQPWNLPLVLIGGATGQLKGGRHLRFSTSPEGADPYASVGDGTPLANLHLAVLDRFGMGMDALHDSSGRLDI